MKIKDLPISERPRERLLEKGAENLSNEDLLAILIKTGCKNYSVRDIAIEVLKRIDTLNNLADIRFETFNNIKGLGKVKIIELLASIELAKRISSRVKFFAASQNFVSGFVFTSSPICFGFNLKSATMIHKSCSILQHSKSASLII